MGWPSLAQEILFHFESADLPVEPDNEGLIGLLAFVAVSAEDTGRSFQQGLSPHPDLTGMDFVPGGQLGHRFPALDRLQGHLGLE